MQLMNKKSGICYDSIYFDSNIEPYPIDIFKNDKSKTGFSYKSLDIKSKDVTCEDGTIYHVEYKEGFEIWNQSYILTQSDGVKFPIKKSEKDTDFEEI